ncbi:MAG: hypothetical protein WC619_00370 [Patescibacteria group bacterium]
MSIIENNIFLKTVLANTPRLLGQLNRNPLSLSYGSFDRAYWHYRTNDISNIRYQEAVLTLALLYTYDFTGNIYYKNKRLLEWINASLEFTLSIQNKDGSFNEWYLNERSYVGTSFASAALAEVLIILGEDNIREYGKILNRLDRAADWITKHTEELVFNQLAGSVLALARIAKLTGNDNYWLASRKKLAIIEKNQSPEGWWSEYGGPDIGYLSLMVDYLVKYYQIEKLESVLAVLKNASAFLVNFLHPNLTSGGEYMSRNTEYIIPSGFAYLSELDRNAKIITAFNSSSLEAGTGLGPTSLDDRYLCYILYNWLQAGIFLGRSNNGPGVDIKNYLKDRRFDIFFKDSSLRVKQNDKYYFVANLYKGGTFRLYAAGKECLDSGVEIKYKKQRLTANVLDYSNKIENKADSLEVRGTLKPVKEPLMKTPIMILFKSFQLIFGRADGLQIFLKDFLRNEMITHKKKNSAGILFKRKFIIAENSIAIEDEVGERILEKDFYCGLKDSYNFIPSSKYFTVQEINNKSGLDGKQYFSAQKGSSLRRICNFD